MKKWYTEALKINSEKSDTKNEVLYLPVYSKYKVGEAQLYLAPESKITFSHKRDT